MKKAFWESVKFLYPLQAAEQLMYQTPEISDKLFASKQPQHVCMHVYDYHRMWYFHWRSISVLMSTGPCTLTPLPAQA